MMSLLAAVAQVMTILVFSWIASPSAATGSVVTHLPGFEGPLPFYFETGYEEIDEAKDAHIFYYFLKSERQPEKDPLVLWLTGGPGCSGFSGLVFEIGPLKIVVAGYNGGLPSLIVPIVAQNMANGNPAGLKVPFNLKGYLVGNPVTDHQFDFGSFVPYAHGMGLISDELYKSAKRSCGGEYVSPRNAKCANSIQLINECLEGVNSVHILEPLCFFVSPKPHEIVTNKSRALKELVTEPLLLKADLPLECRSSGYLLSYSWANNDTVREALHIRKGTRKHWKRCDYDLPYTNDITSAVKFHKNLTSKGFRALVYSGDHDMYVPHVGTQAWIRSLNFSIVDDWRSWSVNGQVAGFTRTYSNKLTFATVKGGGHTAPEYNPKECQAMFLRWMSEVPL